MFEREDLRQNRIQWIQLTSSQSEAVVRKRAMRRTRLLTWNPIICQFPGQAEDTNHNQQSPAALSTTHSDPTIITPQTITLSTPFSSQIITTAKFLFTGCSGITAFFWAMLTFLLSLYKPLIASCGDAARLLYSPRPLLVTSRSQLAGGWRGICWGGFWAEGACFLHLGSGVLPQTFFMF